METSDIKALINILNSSGELPGLQAHPVDQITFSTSSNIETLLNKEEIKTYKELEEQLEAIREELLEMVNNNENLPELLGRFEDASNNLNALSMSATFREGMLNGFRLAQFFLQGVYQSKVSNDKLVK